MRTGEARWRIIGALTWLYAGLVAAGCSERCVAPLTADGARAERITSLLASVPEGKLLASVVPTPVCFHEGASELVGGVGVRLDLRATDASLAARLGHLSYHARHWREPGSDCVKYAKEMRLAEETAHAIEARLATVLNAPKPARPDLDAYERSYRSACAGAKGSGG